MEQAVRLEKCFGDIALVKDLRAHQFLSARDVGAIPFRMARSRLGSSCARFEHLRGQKIRHGSDGAEMDLLTGQTRTP